MWFRKSSLRSLPQHQFNTHLKKQTWVKCFIPPPPAGRDKEQCSVSPSRRSELRLRRLKLTLSPPERLLTISSRKPQDGSISAPRKLSHQICLHHFCSRRRGKLCTERYKRIVKLLRRPFLEYLGDFSRGSSGPRVSFYFWKALCGENKPTFIILPSAFCNLRCL